MSHGARNWRFFTFTTSAAPATAWEHPTYVYHLQAAKDLYIKKKILSPSFIRNKQ